MYAISYARTLISMALVECKFVRDVNKNFTSPPYILEIKSELNLVMLMAIIKVLIITFLQIVLVLKTMNLNYSLNKSIFVYYFGYVA